jgi:hypothetical protein
MFVLNWLQLQTPVSTWHNFIKTPGMKSCICWSNVKSVTLFIIIVKDFNSKMWYCILRQFKTNSLEYKITFCPISYRSFRWEYLPQSRYYMPTKTKNARPLSTSPLCGSTGMVGMPMSVLQSTLGSQPFSRRSVVVAGNIVFMLLECILYWKIVLKFEGSFSHPLTLLWARSYLSSVILSWVLCAKFLK